MASVTNGGAPSETAVATAVATPVATAVRAVSDGMFKPRMNPKQPVLRRLRYAAVAFLLQKLVIEPYRYLKRVKDRLIPSAAAPDQVKRYPCRPHLPIWIYFPKGYDRNKPRPLPTLFTVHGGGFFIGHPEDTDRWNADFASAHGALVVALNYAKAPGNPFPGQPHDVAALLVAALEDGADLARHVDRSRVGLLGWSAGGNLALTAAMLPGVRGLITAGLVPMYPVLDFTIPREVKAKLRRYKPQLGGFRAQPKDFLMLWGGVFDWAYVPAGQDLQNPLLSPLFADRDDLPPRVFVIGCELDLLAHEGWRLACKLGGKRVPAMDEVVGRQEITGEAEAGGLVLDDERFHWEVVIDEDDRRREYRWLLVPDTIHGFDMPVDIVVRDPMCMADATLKRTVAIQEVGNWLWKTEKD